MRFFFVLENRSEPKFGVYFWVEHLHCGVDFWDEYLNYSNGGRIHPLQFCVQTNYGCWSCTILFHAFCFWIFFFELHTRSKNVPVMQQAFGALLVRYSGLLRGESVRLILGWRPPIAFYLPLSSCLLSVAGELVRLFFSFLFVQHNL